MRNDDDNVRHHLPVLRRIIILMAVLTAIPVALWTVTAFVRTYLAAPRVPTSQEMSAAAVTLGSSEAAAAPSNQMPGATAPTGKDAAPIVEAKATASDAADSPVGDPAAAASRPAAMASAAPPVSASNPSVGGSPFPPAPAVAQTGMTATPAAPVAPWPDPAAGASGSSTAVAQPDAAAEPAAAPIAGPVPLPRKRPKMVRVAQAGGIPLPRPRPEAAGPGEPEHTNSPFDFFRNIFQHGGAQPDTPAYSPETEH